MPSPPSRSRMMLTQTADLFHQLVPVLPQAGRHLQRSAEPLPVADVSAGPCSPHQTECRPAISGEKPPPGLSVIRLGLGRFPPEPPPDSTAQRDQLDRPRTSVACRFCPSFSVLPGTWARLELAHETGLPLVRYSSPRSRPCARSADNAGSTPSPPSISPLSLVLPLLGAGDGELPRRRRWAVADLGVFAQVADKVALVQGCHINLLVLAALVGDAVFNGHPRQPRVGQNCSPA